MELRLTNTLRAGLILIILHSAVSSESDWDFCGIWRHSKGKDYLSLNINLTTGCNQFIISANDSSLSISGEITAQCTKSVVRHLNWNELVSSEQTHFCLFWEPLLDQMKLQIEGKNFTLCEPTGLPDTCCYELSSSDRNFPEGAHGIAEATIKNDPVTPKTRITYQFTGGNTSCKTLCPNAGQEDNMSKNDPCAHSAEVEMKEDFRGSNITSPVMTGAPPESATSVLLPPALKKATKNNTKVVCTFFKNNSLFQEGHKEGRVLDDVVGITIENEVIKDLPEPIKITFYHDAIAKTHLRKCVSWDTKKDPMNVNWLVDGCKTKQKGPQHTECHCNHMTYFSVLVQLDARPVRHLLALTAITSLGCAVSVISCVALIVFLCRRSRRSNDQSVPIHLGLAVSLLFLNLLFFFTGILANAGGQGVCVWVGAALHYALLSSFFWMGIEVFHTFWLVCMVFNPSPKTYVWNLVGFILPAVPIIILAAVGDIYGLREVAPSNDVSKPYLMCWMKNNKKAWLAHYFTNMTVLAILVISGIVMLILVYREIHKRNEWRENRVAFLSIWGLSCLFGTTWGLTFLDFAPFSDCILFLSCILNSFQGFLLMLRFYMLDWMRKQADGAGTGSTSTGSTRHHMLHEKS